MVKRVTPSSHEPNPSSDGRHSGCAVKTTHKGRLLPSIYSLLFEAKYVKPYKTGTFSFQILSAKRRWVIPMSFYFMAGDKMTEICENVYVGTIEDYEKIKFDYAFYTVIAAKEPYHRRAVGYNGRSCGKEHPEYLYAERERCLICNLVDVDNPDWISPVIIGKALEKVNVASKNGRKVLICCNQGRSRSASIGMLYMRTKHKLSADFETAEKEYKLIYPSYEPANGIRRFVKNNWN